MKKKKEIFLEGSISPVFISDSIAKHQTKTEIGAHEIFLGQVRADVIDGKTVTAIEFTTYKEMAEDKVHEIREAAFEQFELSCMHIYHSLGNIPVGELCFFVFVSSAHRKAGREALAYIVERIKAEVPIFGKELFENGEYQWKENKLH